jgi:REP element-mobilizing transposase RayT
MVPRGLRGPASRRRSIRLKGYDYTQAGAYFVTICAHRRACLFGNVRDGQMRLNALGRLIAREWRLSATLRTEITMDAFVVMPNHIHGIVWIKPGAGAPDQDVGFGRGVGSACDVGSGRDDRRGPLRSVDDATGPNAPSVGSPPHRPPRSLGSFVAGFKASVTVRINVMRGTPGAPVWQRNYHERIIRDEAALHRIRVYIHENPRQWSLETPSPPPRSRRRPEPG